MSSALSAAQLDRIEDALEDLERVGLPQDLRRDAAVDADGDAADAGDASEAAIVAHLDAYREILALSREAMPLCEPPAGILDGVLAQARASAARGADPVALAAAPEAKAGFWQRVGGSWWLPALGFAGAAALLMVVVLPRDRADEPTAAGPGELARREAPRAVPSGAAVSTADERLADAKLSNEGRAELDAERGAGLQPVPDPLAGQQQGADQDQAKEDQAKGDASAVVPAEVAEEETEQDAPDNVIAAGPARDDADDEARPSPARSAASREKKSAPDDGGGASAPKDAPKNASNEAPNKADKPTTKPTTKPTSAPKAPPPPPAPEPAPITAPGGGKAGPGTGDGDLDADLAKVLARGESRRRAGSCGLARSDFHKARVATDAGTRARALAGLGLCELAAGKRDAADVWFDAARAADATVASFINAERAKLAAAPPEP